jgi:UDP-N-acetyl-2-amino-2-deoxyglucuronate dehydrogenase
VTKLRYGIIGCGAAGKVHAYHLSRNPKIECVVACDSIKENARYFKQHFSFQSIETQWEHCIQKYNLDILSIATPPYLHYEQLIQGLEYSMNILCEKPIVISKIDLASIKKILKKTDCVVDIMLPRRYYNATKQLKQAILQNNLGEITNIDFELQCFKPPEYYSSWRAQKEFVGGGVLMSQAIHSLDQLLYLFGTPTKVKGIVRKTRDYITIEDECEAYLQFSNKIIASFKASANSTKHDWYGKTTIQTTKGNIVLNSDKIENWSHQFPQPNTEEIESVPEIFKPHYYGPGHKKVINNFLKSIESKKTSQANAISGLDSINTALNIYDSSEASGIWVQNNNFV